MTKPLYDRDGVIWFDGNLVPWRDAKVHVLTHSLHYGMGAFEGIRAYQTDSDGLAVFRLRRHMERLHESAHILGIPLEYDVQTLCDACIETLKQNGLYDAACVYIRPLLFYGFDMQNGSIGLHAKNLSTHVIIAAWAWGSYLGQAKTNGARVKTSSLSRHHVNVAMCRAKATGHYINSMLGIAEADADGYDEALFLDTDGYVAEGSGENIFVVKNETLYMPESGSMLYGITRDSVTQLAQDCGYVVIEKRLTRDALYIADEVFFVGTAAEVTPVVVIDRRPIGSGVPGPITKRIQDKYDEVVHGRDKAYKDVWLTYVV